MTPLYEPLLVARVQNYNIRSHNIRNNTMLWSKFLNLPSHGNLGYLKIKIVLFYYDLVEGIHSSYHTKVYQDFHSLVFSFTLKTVLAFGAFHVFCVLC